MLSQPWSRVGRGERIQTGLPGFTATLCPGRRAGCFTRICSFSIPDLRESLVTEAQREQRALAGRWQGWNVNLWSLPPTPRGEQRVAFRTGLHCGKDSLSTPTPSDTAWVGTDDFKLYDSALASPSLLFSCLPGIFLRVNSNGYLPSQPGTSATAPVAAPWLLRGALFFQPSHHLSSWKALSGDSFPTGFLVPVAHFSFPPRRGLRPPRQRDTFLAKLPRLKHCLILSVLKTMVLRSVCALEPLGKLIKSQE